MHAEEGQPPLRSELEAMKPSQRSKRAAAAGATEDEIDAASDADDALAAFVELLLKYEKPAATDPSESIVGSMPPGWQPEFYMPDWTLDKRKRFEALARCAFVLLPQGDQ